MDTCLGNLKSVLEDVYPVLDECIKHGLLNFTLQNLRCTKVRNIVFKSSNFYVTTIKTSLANVNSRSRSLYAIARPSVCRLSVTLVRPTQAVEIYGNIFTALGTLAIH